MLNDTTIQLVQAISSLIAICLGGSALFYSIFAYTRALKAAHYNEIDKAYQTLLNIAFHNTFVLNPETITTEEHKEKYDIYAFMVWNFLETIYDKCMTDKQLQDTWLPIIAVEGKLHYAWFKREDNRPKFKDEFYKLVIDSLGFSTANK